jgi:predicted DNA-binding transcriptional regulator AlpA
MNFHEFNPKWANIEYLTKKQVANLLQVSPRSIESYSAEKNFPTIRISSRKVLYPKSSVLQWLNERKANI